MVSRRGLLQLGGATAATAVAASVLGRADAAVAVRRFYLGTYTADGGKGIAKGRMNPDTGALMPGTAAGKISAAAAACIRFA